jgi:hypothetical protein
MSFLNPWYLLAALAAVVPIIIHLLHRQRARIEVFPSLEFIRRMMRKRTRRFRLKQILLLVVRTLILLLVALALARPSLTGGRAVKGHLPTTAAVILDDSYSMTRQADGGTLFDLAKDKAADVLEYFDQADEVYLLTASEPSRNLSEAWGTRDASRLRQGLAGLAATDLPTAVGGPLKAAAGILSASANPNREIYIISDMQKIGWDDMDGQVVAGGGTGKVLVVDLGEEDPNACVADIGLRLPSGTDDLEMEVTFERFNWPDRQGKVAEVFLKGDLLGRSVFAAGDAARERKTFRLPPFRGFSWGEVALAEDRLRIDDRRYFAIPSRQRVVGLVGDTYYISKALSPEGGGSLTTVEIEEGAITREGLARLDMLILSGVARLEPLEIDALVDYLGRGGSLLVFLGNQVDVGDYNRNLLPRLVRAAAASVAGPEGNDQAAPAGGIRIEGAGTESPADDAVSRGFFTVERVDRGHSIFAKFKPDASPFGDARFYTFMRLQPQVGRTLAWFSDGSPALLEISQRVMLFAGSADPAWGDLVMVPQFVPLLHEAILYLTSGMRLVEDYAAGEEITVRAGDRGGEAYLDGPAGSVRLFPEAIGLGTGYRLGQANRPGVYFVRNEAETLTVFAVNVDPRESDLTKVGMAEVASRIKGFDLKRIAGPDDVGETISLMRKGRDLSRSLLWAALALILAETLLASTLSLRFSRVEDQDALSDN